jgi:hypothetical protein
MVTSCKRLAERDGTPGQHDGEREPQRLGASKRTNDRACPAAAHRPSE